MMYARTLRFCAGVASLFVTTTLAVLALWVLVPALVFRWEPFTMETGSMRPTVVPGDVLLSADAPQTIAPGAIVVFRTSSGQTLAHRVVRVDADHRLATRGDANRVEDSDPVTPAQVRGVGRLVVPLVGLPGTWFRTRQFGNLAAVAVGLALCVWTTRYARAPYDPWRRQAAA